MKFWQIVTCIIAIILIIASLNYATVDTVSVGIFSLKLNEESEYFILLLWGMLFFSIIFSWKASAEMYSSLHHVARSKINELTYGKIAQYGAEAYPDYQELAGNFKYSELKKIGHLTLLAHIIIGTNMDGTAILGDFKVHQYCLTREILLSYMYAVFIEGFYLAFLPYILSIVCIVVTAQQNFS